MRRANGLLDREPTSRIGCRHLANRVTEHEAWFVAGSTPTVRVENVEDVLNVGQKILVEITKTDDRGKLSLAPVLAEGEGGDALAEGEDG